MEGGARISFPLLKSKVDGIYVTYFVSFRFCHIDSFYQAVEIWVMVPQIRLLSWLMPRIRTVTRLPRGGRPRLG